MNTLRYFDFGAARPVLLLIARIAVTPTFDNFLCSDNPDGLCHVRSTDFENDTIRPAVPDAATDYRLCRSIERCDIIAAITCSFPFRR